MSTKFEAFERIPPGNDPSAMTHVVLLCDHARNTVPPEVGGLGVPEEDMARHIAWDVGARGVTLGLAARLGSGAVISTFSLLAGDLLDHDLRAEISLLRAELDMLKRAFRRHCAETT